MPQVGIYATQPPSPHTHGSPSQGGTLDPDIALVPFPKVEFGDGSDGDVVINGSTLLTRDMAYNNLSITVDGRLFPHGHLIKVKGKLSIAGAGTIEAEGTPGHSGAVGLGGAGGDINYYTTRLPYKSLPTGGAPGGNGGGAGSNLGAGGSVPDPVLIGAQALFEGRIWAGCGGAGGGGVGSAPTAGGAPSRILAGAKGGNGATGIWISGVQNKGGGGGGGGGGLIEIWCNEIDNLGDIYAYGAGGGSGEEDANAQAGGGGGGGGGAILIFYKVLSGGGLGARIVTGGAGGGTLNPGLPGAAGYSYAIQIGV